ncbi:hypothetical protein P43SY_001824 [Pythium insidiosum]|uniref:Glycoside hydrolase n=1 Tax=Pythium insidiosum TaxID=114742 RepID=A0AAD5Q735_PYTIN|nr:hypothetical protein P43SY_001824 [Pythium insidiosum]
MRVSLFQSLACAAAVVAALLGAADAQSQKAMPICSAWKAASYEDAKKSYPDLANQLNVVAKQGVVPWYTDNSPKASLESMLSLLSKECGAETKIPMVVYGIPNKDCEAGYSNSGFNKNWDDYKAFIDRLAKTFPTQNMIYIVEPDAVGLTANGGCGIEKEYPKYLKYALETLSANSNAELFLDVGFWTLQSDDKAEKVAKALSSVSPANGKSVKGIALNTSNYQKTEEMLKLCDSFARTSGKPELQCIIDTSRNYKGPTKKNEWCNAKNTGIGQPPTMETGNRRAAYFLWVKPPGESDGKCDAQTSGESMVGPDAGKFFKDHFAQLWENGYFKEKGDPSGKEDGVRPTPSGGNSTASPSPSMAPSSAPSSSPVPSASPSTSPSSSPAPSSSAPVAPGTVKPADGGNNPTPPPTTKKPKKKCNVKRRRTRQL